MQVIVSWNAPEVQRKLSHAVMADDMDEVRRINQSADLAKAIWRSWAESMGGTVLSMGMSFGSVAIEADRLSELGRIRTQYSEAVGSSVQVGVGTKTHESARALELAKRKGGVVLFTPETEEELAEQDEADKPTAVLKSMDEFIDDLYKDELTAVDGDHGGFGGHAPPSAPTVTKPKAEASEHSQGEAMAHLMNVENPGRPERTHAAEDFEDQFHGLAQEHHQNEAREQMQQQGKEDIKAHVVQVLSALREKTPVIAQLKQADPETYAVVLETVRAMVDMARQITGKEE